MHDDEKADAFASFDAGNLALPGGGRDFSRLPWNPHPRFPGVSLKHLVTAADTGGRFSYHLVRIEPACAIGSHAHETQLETHEVVAGGGVCVNAGMELAYAPGVLSIFAANSAHEVRAGGEGLRLFAKFMPALC